MLKRRVRWPACFPSGTAALALGLLAPALAGAQAPVPAGAEFQVNTYTTGRQDLSSVSANAAGDFVVVWRSNGSYGTDTSGYSIQGQRYASNGSALGAQFQVNTYTTGNQAFLSVAAEASGDFVVVWDSNGSSGTDTSGYSVQGQRYASGGSTRGAQFQVNPYTPNNQRFPSVVADAAGDFVVVWQSNGSFGTDTSGYSIQGRRYASDGSILQGSFQVNTYTTNDQRAASVAADADGDFVVVWQSNGSYGTDTDGYSIQGQRYASNGSARGAQFQVNTYTTNIQNTPSVAAAANGDFVVVWTSVGSYGTDTSANSIQGQRYASDGSTQGAQFQVNTYTTGNQNPSSVAAAASGDFVVVWQSNRSSGTDTSDFSVQGQRYASNGSALGAQFQVNTYTTNGQYVRHVAAAANGDFVVVWHSVGSSGTDTSNSSVQGQRYSVPAPVPPVPAMSRVTRFALGAALMLLGATYALRRRS